MLACDHGLWVFSHWYFCLILHPINNSYWCILMCWKYFTLNQILLLVMNNYSEEIQSVLTAILIEGSERSNSHNMQRYREASVAVSGHPGCGALGEVT